ncbi:hypothetical protein [Bacillus smithii]|uniref:hypothetical protein n=1 Tax=Bacillus smithii TaxID=1479 RepID=UPI002E202C30|nr:hypothetical protein [Bacillus smithii]
MFSTLFSTPNMFVDDRVWKHIKNSLPENYVLPNPVIKEMFKPMSGDFYNSLFSTPLSTPEVFVDHEVWESIKASLPPDYVIPNPVMRDVH